MVFAIGLILGVIVVVSFFSTEKRLHMYEYWFVYLVFVGVLVTCFDVLTPRNSHYVKITKEMGSYGAMRLVEISVFPLVVLFYLEAMHGLRTLAQKVVATLLCVSVLFGVESGLVVLRVIVYDQWKIWWSWPAWLCLVLFAYALQQGFRKLLQREGVSL